MTRRQCLLANSRWAGDSSELCLKNTSHGVSIWIDNVPSLYWTTRMDSWLCHQTLVFWKAESATRGDGWRSWSVSSTREAVLLKTYLFRICCLLVNNEQKKLNLWEGCHQSKWLGRHCDRSRAGMFVVNEAAFWQFFLRLCEIICLIHITFFEILF